MDNVMIYSIILALSGITIFTWLDKKKLNIVKYAFVVLCAVLTVYFVAICSTDFFANAIGEKSIDGNPFNFVCKFFGNISSFTNPLFRAITLVFAAFALVILTAAALITVCASCQVIRLIKRIRSKHCIFKLKKNIRKTYILHTQRRQVRRIFLCHCRLNN